LFDAYRQLVEKGREKGWKQNAPAMMFRAKFGFFPWRSWTEALASEKPTDPAFFDNLRAKLRGAP
jgi:hypothetical protein